MNFSPPSKQRIASLTQAATSYHNQLTPDSPAAKYLASRGLTPDSARSFQLGYVADPASGHERYTGMLAIPYINMQGVVAIRYRCISNHPDGLGEGCKDLGHTKYVREPGDEAKVYSITTLTLPVQRVAICEGEIDTQSATQAGIPTIGVAGAQNWKPLFNRLIRGYREVVILADGDTAGLKLADAVMAANENARVCQMPEGLDVNKYYLERGADALREKAGF